MNISLKMKHPKSVKFLGLASGLTLAVLLLFQNCSGTEEQKKDEASMGDSAGFPFETDIDTLSYMSCSRTGTAANPRAYYTFRAGAYQAGGIGLSPAFISNTNSAGQRSETLQSSSNNSGSYLQMSIRQRNSYQTVLGGNSGIQEGYHFYNFLDTLSAPVLADRLGRLGGGEKVNYFSGTSGLDGKLVEGSLRFFDGETQSAAVRNYLMNDMLIGMTYSMPGSSDGWTARAPDMADPKKVYGKGYKVNFKLWGSQASGINRLLQGVTEMDLVTGLPASNKVRWDCNAYDAYIIVRAQDVPGYCSAVADPRPSALSSADRLRLEKIRRVLRVEDWWVDLARGCVVPKNAPNGGGGACYGAGAAAQTVIQYAVGAPNSGVTTCDVNTCPHYVSVCTRTVTN